MSKSENFISEINEGFFFKEFTYSKNNFHNIRTNSESQFSDNVVWLDELLMIFEVKDREGDSSEEKWFENKIMRKSVRQIKNTMAFLYENPEISIENHRGHRLNIVEAKDCFIRKIIIYTPNVDFPENLRWRKFYNSSEIGLVHLFHSEDYYWICKYLHTPAEIDEYFQFREDFYSANLEAAGSLPEQYFLSHFFDNTNVDHVNPTYIQNLGKYLNNQTDFDVSFIVNNFDNRVGIEQDDVGYYDILKQIAKLNRFELKEFRARWIKMFKTSELNKFDFPYRIYFPAINCAFIFIPIQRNQQEFAANILYNYTTLHQYEMKALKCVGVISYIGNIKSELRQIDWLYAEGEWEYSSELEEMIKQNYPFRELKNKDFSERYKSNGS